jgi:hypothetical protein
MTRKSGIHFCDKVMLKLLIWRMFLSIRRFRKSLSLFPFTIAGLDPARTKKHARGQTRAC